MLLEIGFDMIRRGVFESPAGPWDWTNTLVLTLAGFFIVFLLLFILIIVFTVFGKIMAKANEKEAAKKAAQVQSSPVSAAGSNEVDEETAAVIVAALTEARGGKAVVIKDIKEADK